MHKYLALTLLLFSAQLYAETDWYRVAANTALIADWLQTHEIASSENFYETNHILGEHPSSGAVNRYFISSILLTNVIGELLPSVYSDYFYLTVVVVETKAVLDNYRLGIRVRF